MPIRAHAAEPLELPLELAVSPEQVVVRNAAASGTVFLLGVGREIADYGLTRRVWRELLADGDGDGVISFPLDPPGWDDAMWVAVDLASGRLASVEPPPALGRGLLEPRLRGQRRGTTRSLVDDRKQAYVLIVTSAGTWWLAGGDGTERDLDGEENGQLELDLERPEPLGPATPATIPQLPGPGDRVVLLDPDRMELVIRPLITLLVSAE